MAKNLNKIIEQKDEIIKNMEQTIESLMEKIRKRNKMIEDFKEIVGNDNFDNILNLQGYKLKK